MSAASQARVRNESLGAGPVRARQEESRLERRVASRGFHQWVRVTQRLIGAASHDAAEHPSHRAKPLIGGCVGLEAVTLRVWGAVLH